MQVITTLKKTFLKSFNNESFIVKPLYLCQKTWFISSVGR